MSQDLQRARELFLHAVGQLPPEQWDAYLAEACGPDDELRRQVAHLLQVHREAGSFLDRPAGGPAATGALARGPEGATAAFGPEAAGTVIGPYKLLEQIGEGGMGTVWMAEQKEPIQRRVAVKVIKAGMDSKQVLARFEAERQALALMDHPNIARVLDAGTTGAGRPYFVMELVKGTPITKYCDDKHLSVRQRLELFGDVCRAVQHAHQKGIIHRDLKPRNILIAPFDGKPVPKVIDFGVAKATGQRLTDATLFTGFGAVVGTPEYMSPEQAETNNQDIDTRSDIYSLGVLLYELLTGSTPLTKKRVKEAALLEVLRVIREEEPPKPSTRLSSTEELPSVAAQRHTEPAKLTKLVRGELDWIVMKALEKDRNRRYETANAFAADVQRYLNDETVLACPPSPGYRLRKFARRNKRPVLAGSLVVLALVGGMVGTMVGLVRAEQARKDAVAAEGAEAEQRRLADDERAVAQAVNDFLQWDVLRQADSRVQADRGFNADPNLTVREALHRAAARIGDRFRDQPLVEAAIRQAIGEAYAGVGEYQLAASHLERALTLRKANLGADHLLTLGSMYCLGNVYMNVFRPYDARALFEETVKLRREKLGPDHRDTLESQLVLAASYRESSRLPEAVVLHEETLKLAESSLGCDDGLTLRCRIYLAMAYALAGRFPEGIARGEEALRISSAKRGPRYPGTLFIRGDLGWIYELAGRFREAISLHEETLDLMNKHLSPDHPHTFAVLWSLVRCYRGAGQFEKALALGDESAKVAQARYGPRALITVNSRAVLAEVHMDRGRFDLAEPLLRQCLAILDKDWPDDWGTFKWKSVEGAALLGLKKFTDAEPILLKGYRGLKERAARISPNAHGELTTALERLVRLYDAWDKPDEAAKWRKELEALTIAAGTVVPARAK
jgi:serine/threonine protein kinase